MKFLFQTQLLKVMNHLLFHFQVPHVSFLLTMQSIYCKIAKVKYILQKNFKNCKLQNIPACGMLIKKLKNRRMNTMKKKYSELYRKVRSITVVAVMSLLICCLTALAYSNRRVIRAVIKGEPLSKKPREHQRRSPGKS